ncbi:hypothetical protein GUITHDRAFT_121029, partial [Guillardia theta CCMP2712]
MAGTAPALVMALLVLGGWTTQTEGATNVMCGNCSFTVSDAGLLQRTGSCLAGTGPCVLKAAGIAEIERGTFDGLADMTYLDLSHNQLTNISQGLFDGLSSLQLLDLRYNQLSSIAPDAFSNCTQLSSIDVGFNQLTCYYASWPLLAMALDSTVLARLCQNVTTDVTPCYPHIRVELDSTSLPSDMAGEYCEAFNCAHGEGISPGRDDSSHCFRKNGDEAWKILNTGCGWTIGHIEQNGERLYPSRLFQWQEYARSYIGDCSLIPPSQLDVRALANTSNFYDGGGRIVVGIHTVLVLPPHHSSDADPSADIFNATSAVNSSSASTPLPLVDTSLLSFPECVEQRDWAAMLELLRNGTAATGGLGLMMEPPLESWVCIREHPCLQRIDGAQPSDMMCFVYHEVDLVFLPWSTNSLLKLVGSRMSRARVAWAWRMLLLVAGLGVRQVCTFRAPHLTSSMGYRGIHHQLKVSMMRASSTSLSLGKEVRKDFPILKQKVHGGKDLIYLDSAATSQKPVQVLEAMKKFYEESNSNVHRGSHALSVKATDMYEGAREIVAKFVNARREEIVFTSGATEAINLLNSQQGFDMDHFRSILSDKTKIVAVVHVSNMLGCINPVQEIVAAAHAVGAKILLDACQSAPHMPLDVRLLDCDFLVASGHKLCGPSGSGFLYGKKEILESMPPWK